MAGKHGPFPANCAMITSIKPPGGSCRANESILSLPREARPHFLLCRFFRLQVHFGIPKLTHIEELHAGHFVPKLPDPITGQGAPGANGPEATMKMAGSLEVVGDLSKAAHSLLGHLRQRPAIRVGLRKPTQQLLTRRRHRNLTLDICPYPSSAALGRIGYLGMMYPHFLLCLGTSGSPSLSPVVWRK